MTSSPPSRDYLPSHWTTSLSLPQALGPWSAVTRLWTVTYRFSTPSRTHGVVAVVTLNLEKLFSLEQSGSLTEHNRRTLREAMELCALHWQLHPPALRAKLQLKSPDLVKELELQGVCLDVVDLEFELEVSDRDIHWLCEVIVPTLSKNTCGDAFQSVRDGFLYQLSRNMTKVRPVRITVAVKVEDSRTTIGRHVERCFGELARFADFSKGFRVAGNNYAESVSFVLTHIYVSIDAIHITRSVVRCILDFAAVNRHLVSFDMLTLDPRMTKCSNTDVRRLLRVVADGSPRVLVTTGNLPTGPNPLEMKEFDPISTGHLLSHAQGILEAIARTKNVMCVDLSLVVFLLQAQQFRKVLWKALASSLTHSLGVRSLPELVINAPVALDDEDAEIIRGERRHHKRREVKAMSIDVVEATSSVVLELVSLAGSVESLSLSRRQGVFSMAMLVSLVKIAPSVHSLEIDRIHIDCAATVIELSSVARWQSLSLVDVEIVDLSVIFAFLRELGDPTCPLSKALRVFRLSSRTNDLAVSNEAVHAFAKSLETNHVLQCLHLTVENNVSPEAIAAILMHNGDLVLQPQPRHRAAFLSIFNHVPELHPLQRVDNYVVRNIFSFSTIQARRQVTVRLAPVN